jgi:hypothetical protein
LIVWADLNGHSSCCMAAQPATNTLVAVALLCWSSVETDSACVCSDFVVCATGSTDRFNPFGPFNVDYQVCSPAMSHTMSSLCYGLASHAPTCCKHVASLLQLISNPHPRPDLLMLEHSPGSVSVTRCGVLLQAHCDLFQVHACASLPVYMI